MKLIPTRYHSCFRIELRLSGFPRVNVNLTGLKQGHAQRRRLSKYPTEDLWNTRVEFLLYESFLIFNRSEFPTTITSEKAMDSAATMGFNKPTAAMGIATIL